MNSDYQLDIINRIRKLRLENRLSQSQLAEYLGISNGQFGNIESTKYAQKYTLSQLYRICKLFNMPIQHLFIEEYEYMSDIDVIDLLIQKIIKYEE